MNLNSLFTALTTPVFRWRSEECEPFDVAKPIEPEKVWSAPEGLRIIKEYKPLLSATHLLIAGTTGAGKSVCLNGFVYSILGKCSPNQAKLILIDPKRVELSAFKGLPHTLNYTNDGLETECILSDILDTIEDRYTTLSELSIKKWRGAKIYIIIDELADLLISPNGKAIKLLLQKILQIGRAAGVSVIACTQAPNRTIIPANLTLNFTDRIALRCISPVESRQIVQIAGAEKLPQYGKGIYLNPRGLETINIPMIQDDDIQDRVDYWMSI